MKPRSELVQCDDRRARHYLMITGACPDDRHPQHAIVADQPMNGSWLESVAHKERVDLPIQPFDANPGRKRQRLEFPRDSEANTVADALEFQSSLFRPPAFRPLTTHEGCIRHRSERLSKVVKLPPPLCN